MQFSDIPLKFPIPFANAAGPAFIRTTPTLASPTPGVASLTTGFPPVNFQPIASGGIPPGGADFNGVLFRVSGWARWVAAGGPIVYDAAFSTDMGGYPAGAFLQSAVTPGRFYISTVDNNVSNPDLAGPDWIIVVPSKATLAEIAAGVNDASFITPAGLADLRATPADILAGSSVSKYITPNALSLTLDSVAGSPGSMTHPNGFIEQWGVLNSFASGEGAATLPFPTPFPNAVFNVQMTAINLSNSNQRDLVPQWTPTASLTTLSYYRQGDGGGGENMEGVSWRAIGN